MEFFSSRALFHRHAQLRVAFGVRRTVTVKFLRCERLFQVTASFEQTLCDCGEGNKT